MKSIVGVGTALFVLSATACSSSSSGTFIPNEGGTDGGGTTGSTGPDGKVVTGGACAGATKEAAQACTGLACIGLATNKQGKAGICTESCDSGTCAKGGKCLNVPNEGAYCFKACTTDTDCVDGFACLDDGAGDQICLVTPTTTTDGG